MVVNEGARAPPHKCDLTRCVARCPAIENEQLIVFAEVQLLLAACIHLVGAEVCACLQVSWKLVKGLHFRRHAMSIKSNRVRCRASVCICVPTHPVVWLLAIRHPAGKIIHVCSQFMKGVKCFVRIVRGHVACSKGNMLTAAAMRLNVQPDICAIICSFPKFNIVSHALLHVHSNATPGTIAALQVLGAVHFMADIAWQVKHSIPRRSPGLSQTYKCAVQSMQVMQCISLVISTVEPAMHVPKNTGELNAVTPFFLGHPLRGWPRQLCLWHR